MKRQGFTLIELVVVIVILGIMAAVAVPKFVNLQSNARQAVMEGLEGSIRSVATLIYSKSLIQGVETGNSSAITVNGVVIRTKEGYPAIKFMHLLIDLSGAGGDITVVKSAGVFTHSGRAGCTVTYVEAVPAAGAIPATPSNVTTDFTGC